jgi:methyl-accepting chemotaxis protein
MIQRFERYIPDTLRHDPEVFRQARLIVSIGFIAGCIAFFYGVQHLFIAPSIPSVIILWITGIALVAAPLLLRATASVPLAGNLLVGSYWCAAAGLMYVEGGINTEVRFWYIATPLMATLLLGMRSGLRWGAATVAAITAFFLLDYFRVPLPTFTPSPEDMELQGIISVCGLAVFMAILARLAESAKNTSLSMLEQVRHEEQARQARDYQALQALTATNQQQAAEDLARIQAQQDYLASSVESILHSVSRFADGDLTVSLEVGANDDIARLSHRITTSVSTIRQMMEHVVDAIDQAADAIAKISTATEQLAVGAHEQFDQIAHISGAVEEMSRTIAANTEQTSLAAFEASEASMDAQQGGEIMHTMVANVKSVAAVVRNAAEKIAQLGASSEKIGEIVSVIDEIADQTNLLALNAAIEAARAGEQGKGFTVVAGEVRQLAERTQQATKQISAMIKGIQQEMTQAVTGMKRGTTLVQQGEQLVEQTAQALDTIVSRTSKAADVISQVAVASEEQAATSDEMATNVARISNSLKESSGGLQTIARSIEALLQQAELLQTLARRFFLGRSVLSASTPADMTHSIVKDSRTSNINRTSSTPSSQQQALPPSQQNILLQSLTP